MSKSLNYRDYWYERSYIYKRGVFETLKTELGLNDTELRSLIFDGKVVPVVVLNPSGLGIDVTDRIVDISWVVDNEDSFVTVGSYAGLGILNYVVMSTTDAIGGNIRIRVTIDGNVVLDDVELTKAPLETDNIVHFPMGLHFSEMCLVEMRFGVAGAVGAQFGCMVVYS